MALHCYAVSFMLNVSVTYKPFMLSVIMLSGVMLSVAYNPFMLSDVMLSVTYKPFMVSVVILSVVILSVVAPF